MRAARATLTTHEVAVRSRRDAGTRFRLVVVHREAHGATRKPPLKARVPEDLVQALLFGEALHFAAPGDGKRPHARCDLAAPNDFGRRAEVFNAPVSAGADEDRVDGGAENRLARLQFRVAKRRFGARALDASALKAKYLINIDSEEERVLTVSCAGACRTLCTLPVTRVPFDGETLRVKISGLVGGHSGEEIHKGRANAIALLGRWLTLLEDHGVQYAVLALSGGAKENVIPKESSVTLVLPAGITEAVHVAAADFAAQMQAEYGTADPAIRLQLTEQGCGAYSALDADSTQRLRKALLLMPWGVQAMSMDVPGLVETSLNLGVAELGDAEAILRFSVRSSVPSAKELLARKVQTLTELLGGSVRFHGDYPAWTYARESALRDRCVAVYDAQYGATPQIVALHAGLECGILSGKIDGLDCISFGPNLLNVHTPNERADIASVARVWEYLKAILAYKE